MGSKIIDKINEETAEKYKKSSFNIGDQVKVHTKIKEGDKERIQVFAGIVIANDGGKKNGTFTVRRVSHGVGVEKVFPVNSPNIEAVEVEKASHVRRAKLYYLRDRGGKRARLREKIR